MLKKIIKMMLVVCIVFVLCGVNGQMSHANNGDDKLPTISLPNSVGYEYGPDGEVKKERRYGPDGRAQQDTDYSHGGAHHKFPHDHDWDWSMGYENPKRKDGVPRPGAKELPSPKDTKKGKKQKKKWSLGRIKDVFKRRKNSKVIKGAKKAAILGTAGTITYIVISEGSRILFPIRNLIPVL